MNGSTGRDARDEAFVMGKQAPHLHGLFCRNLHYAVNNVGCVVLGDEVGTYALYAMRRGFASTEQRGFLGFYGNGEELRVMRLETSGSAAEGSASTNGGNEDIHLSVGVVPNLLCRSENVRFGIGRI